MCLNKPKKNSRKLFRPSKIENGYDINPINDTYELITISYICSINALWELPLFRWHGDHLNLEKYSWVKFIALFTSLGTFSFVKSPLTTQPWIISGNSVTPTFCSPNLLIKSYIISPFVLTLLGSLPAGSKYF